MKELGATEEDGTRHTRIEELASQKHGLGVESIVGCTLEKLEQHLKAGQVAIVAMQAWHDEEDLKYDYTEEWEDGHYVVVVGFDQQNIYMMVKHTLNID